MGLDFFLNVTRHLDAALKEGHGGGGLHVCVGGGLKRLCMACIFENAAYRACMYEL